MTRLLNEFKSLKKFDIILLIISEIAIIITTIFTNNTILGIITSITGVCYVILNGCRLSTAFIFGIVNTLLYGITAYQNGLYGDFMLNVFYSCPMCVVGLISWIRHNNKNDLVISDVEQFSIKQRFILYSSVIACIITYGFILMYLNDTQPFIDSSTTVLSIFAYFCLVRRKTDTWYLFNCSNILSIIMWFINYKHNNANLAILMMFAIYTVNSLLNTYKWEKSK